MFCRRIKCILFCLHVDYSILHVRFLVCRSIVTYVLEIKYILFFFERIACKVY